MNNSLTCWWNVVIHYIDVNVKKKGKTNLQVHSPLPSSLSFETLQTLSTSFPIPSPKTLTLTTRQKEKEKTLETSSTLPLTCIFSSCRGLISWKYFSPAYCCITKVFTYLYLCSVLVVSLRFNLKFNLQKYITYSENYVGKPMSLTSYVNFNILWGSKSHLPVQYVRAGERPLKHIHCLKDISDFEYLWRTTGVQHKKNSTVQMWINLWFHMKTCR